MSEEKSKQDKRKTTSAKNLAKARQTKLEKLKQEKEINKYQFEESDSDSESEDEMIVVKPMKRKKAVKNAPVELFFYGDHHFHHLT